MSSSGVAEHPRHLVNRLTLAIVGTLLLAPIAPAALAASLHFDEPRPWLNLPITTNISAREFGDVNGDGKADFVGYDQFSGTAVVALSSGQSFGTLRRWASGLPASKSTSEGPWISVADVNGDRKADLIVFKHGDGQVAGSADVHVALSNGAGFQYTEQPVWNDGFCITEQVCKVADLNGDGKADLVAFTPLTGLVWASLSEGNRFGANAIWHKYFCISGEICDVGDVDGDRKSDILLLKPRAVGAQKGNVLIAGSTGSQFGTARYGHGYFCIDQERCLIGDLNADGKADMVLIKGMSADIQRPAEALVSLSDGEKFINATPFAWGKNLRRTAVGGWGTFALADVTGDGRSDLVLTESLSSPEAPGSVTGTRLSVYAVTDQGRAPVPDQVPPPGGDSEPALAGVRQVNLFNCEPDQHRLYYWVADATLGTRDSKGPVDAMYSEAGSCPDANDAPFTIDLTDGHIFEIVAVDPARLLCEGRNDPTILGCIVQRYTLRGNAKGGVLNIVIPGN
jgi:hypothetical protein